MLLIVGGLVLLAVAVGACAVVLGGAGGSAPGVQVALEGAEHSPVGSAIRYARTPPSSGTHYPQLARYGVQEQEIAQGYWVHNLEHGAIVVLYNCPAGCPDLVAQLQEAYSTFPASARFNTVKMVVSPYPKLQTRLAYLAWGWEYLTDTYQRDELFRFYQAHLDKGPELAP